MHFGGLPQIGQLAQTIAGTSAGFPALHSCHLRALPQDVDLGESVFRQELETLLQENAKKAIFTNND